MGEHPAVVFTESADFYDDFYAHKDYAGEVDRLRALARERVPAARTWLDVACGTGRHLELLAAHYACSGVDLDPALLVRARARCPDVAFTVGDMRSFALDRRFDVVTCLFSSIGYAHDLDGLHEAVANLAAHLTAGGLLIVEPWLQPDEWETDRVAAETPLRGGHDALVRMFASGRDGDVSHLDIHYLIGHEGEVSYRHEHHELGLFTWEQYRAAFEAAGLTDVDVDHEGLIGRGLVTGVAADRGSG